MRIELNKRITFSTMEINMKLKQLREEANSAGSIYEKTRMDYEYMSVVLNQVKDISCYRHEIESFQQLCLIYLSVYNDDIYGKFLELLQKLMNKMD
jgi:hypothetical protein